MTPRIVHTLPHTVRDIENCWIPLTDGCRLAARIWLPESAESRPVPAIVESIPYGKRGPTRWRDEPMHRYFAGHGYAAVRIDLRGTGESDGLLEDEYLDRELDDAEEALRWIASQSWCNGRIGVMGKSWGGIHALLLAARQPPGLQAVITVCSTDDRYADDAHFMGGCLLNENLIWGSVLFTRAAQPPDPALVGERWREMWLRRLDNLPVYPELWLRHQHRDAYWERGSVCEDYSRVRCPVYAVGGWADGYTNAVPRLLAGLSAPRKGLVGPWAHVYPHEGVPGPAIGFLQEALRWWDHWLKDLDTGVMDEPIYRVWMQDSVQPRSFYDERPGRWVAETSWPSSRIRSMRWNLGRGTLNLEPGTSAADAPQESWRKPRTRLRPLTIRSPQTVGLAAGSWCGFGVEGEMPTDQREDDGRSLIFDSEPLDDDLEILGEAEARLQFAADQPTGIIAVRVNDVAPDGASTRVSYGLLNLTHRGGHREPRPLVPGRREQVTVALNHVAHRFPAGHRIRLAISTGYWPVVWPAPRAFRLSVFPARSSLTLPVRPPREADEHLPPFPPPEAAPPPPDEDLHPEGVRRTIQKDLVTGEIVSITITDTDADDEPAMSRLEEIGLEIGHAVIETFRIREEEPLSARSEVIHRTVMRRAAWSARVETRVRLSASEDCFHLEAELEARDAAGKINFSRTWRYELPRHLV